MAKSVEQALMDVLLVEGAKRALEKGDKARAAAALAAMSDRGAKAIELLSRNGRKS